MDVLVVESEAGAASIAVAQLEAAGHRVERCHEPGDGAFPCAGLATGRCPIEHGAIDVVLTVRPRPSSRPSPLEDGVICALRRHVPVVVAGRTKRNPFSDHAATLARVDEVVDACERAATGPQPRHEAVATAALRETLTRAGLAVGAARADVRRSGHGLRVTVHLPSGCTPRRRGTASVRVVGALRAFDMDAARIEIECKELP